MAIRRKMLKRQTPGKRSVFYLIIFWVFSDQYFVFEKKMQNRDRKEAKQSKAAVQQPSAVESDGKSDSGSEIDANSGANVSDGKVHVEFTEEEIIAPETNTVQFKVCVDLRSNKP